MGYLRIDIETISAEQQEILIAELSEMKFYAFEEKERILSAYITEQNFDEQEMKTLLEPQGLNYIQCAIPEINWNQKWEEEFSPVIIEDFACIRASFHLPVKSVKHDIIITPKMSFGTGHHPTTFLMKLQMKETDFTNKKVLDFGTGTGILAILAKKMGAVSVTAIDNDDVCILNAKENINNNKLDITLFKRDTIKNPRTFDIILANINRNTILDNLEDIKKLMGKSSRIIISGFLQNDAKELMRQFSGFGMKNELVLLKEGWLSIKFRNGER